MTMSKLRILALFTNFDYINPNPVYIKNGLTRFFDVVYYGPGYSKVYTDRVDKVYKDCGPFDAVMIDTFPLFFKERKEFQRNIDNTTLCLKYSRRFHYEYPNYPMGLYNIDAPLFLYPAWFDPYAVDDMTIEIIRKFPGLVIGSIGKEYAAGRDEILKDVVGPDARMIYGRTIKELVEEIGDLKKLITFPFSIQEKEYLQPKRHKLASLVIPGVRYTCRQKAVELLKPVQDQTGIKVLTQENISNLFIHWTSINKYRNWRHRKCINSSKYAYTCGSMYRYPLRKFFEIPAAGSLLIAHPFKNHELFGFKHMQNFVSAEPEEILGVIEMLEDDADMYDKIVSEGQRLIKEKHMTTVRLSQLRKIVESVVNNDYDDYMWVDGDLIIKDRSGKMIVAK